ncbi:MAG: cytochrome c oxidase assembly protein [Trebonia sp.]
MTTALPAPSVSTLVTQWSWQPIAIAALVALAWWYLRTVRRFVRAGARWPIRRNLTFGFGLLVALWSSCGFLQAYVDSMYWAWTTQVLTLWLLVPSILLAAQPVQLALATGGTTGWLAGFLRSRPARVLGNPLVGPALLPLLSAVLFFGPLPGWAVTLPVLGWPLQALLVVVGAMMLLPLVGLDEGVSSLAVAMTLALGSFELVLDAIPGIVLRLHNSLVSSYFEHRVIHPWSNSHLHDQQTAGSILWVISEVIDLPFLLLVFRRWLRADEREAAAVDAVLEAEHAARAGIDGVDEPPGTGTADVPWWITDPAMQRRMRGQG